MSKRDHRGKSEREFNNRRAGLEILGLALSLFLVINQSIGLIAARASSGAGLVSLDRGAGFVSTPTVDHGDTSDALTKTTRQTTKQTTTHTTPTGPAVAQPSLNVNLDQWANLAGKGWQNGDLNGNNSAYHEGDVVPFRLAIEGLSAGSHTIHINYDFTAGGHEAYDFLATWNETESPNLCATGGGAVSSMCPGLPSPDTKTFPSDSFTPGSPTKAGLDVAGAEAASGVSRDLTMYGGTITSITGPTHSGSVGGNSTGDFAVTFVSSDGAVLFAWGGHIAESAYWVTTADDPNGAAAVSGAPWHMRTQSLDNSGNKNQDRSIQPSAIVPVPDLTVDKVADPTGPVTAGNPIGFAITVTNTGNVGLTNVTLTDTLPTGSGISWSVDNDGGATCAITSGTDLSCTMATLAKGSAFTVHVTSPTTNDSCATYDNTANVTADGGLSAQSGLASVTVQGCLAAPQLIVIKHVINDNGGTAVAGDFTLDSGGINDTPDDFAGDETGTKVTLDPGSYNVSETGPSGYAASFSADCTGTIALGETKTCTVTNDDIARPPSPPPLGIQIIKGGPASAHVGDTITYTFDVSLTTSTPLTNITVTDPICDTGPTLVSKDGGDQDATLEPGETWHYSCPHTITATDPDPLPNTATATGTDSAGDSTSDTDSHSVDIIHPAIQIVKTAEPTSGSPGDVITYTYEVTNTGDVDLVNVSVDDDVLGHIGDIAVLHVGETVKLTAKYKIPDQTGPIVNIVVASGTDTLGEVVTDEDTQSVDVVLGTTVTPPPTKTPPGGLAFTGTNVAIPLAAAALILLMIGSGLMWIGRRREVGDEG